MMTGGGSDQVPLVAVGHSTPPYLSAYHFNNGSFGAKLANPAVLPANGTSDIAFSPTGSHIVYGTGFTSSYLGGHKMDGAAFGVALAAPSNPPTGYVAKVAFSPSGSHVAAAHYNAPAVSVYPWSPNPTIPQLAFGSKVTNPTVQPTGLGLSVAWSPSGSHILVGHSNSPYISAYNWTGTGFGTKLANPAFPNRLPTGGVQGIAFSPNGAYVALAHANTPYITVYSWSAAGFGTIVPDPIASMAISGTPSDIAFSPDGSFIAVSHQFAPFITIYNFNGSFASQILTTGVLPDTGHNVRWSANGRYLAVGHSSSPYGSVFNWFPTISGLSGQKIANPSTLPIGNFGRVAFANI